MHAVKAVISAKEGNLYRCAAGGTVSAPLPLIKTSGDTVPVLELAPGDEVAVLFFGSGFADGCILGKLVDRWQQ